MELLVRAAQLKQRLLQFALSPEMDAHFQQMLAGISSEDLWMDPMRIRAALIDTFALEYVLPDGQRVIDRFLAQSPALADPDRALVDRWREVREGVFFIEARDEGTVRAYNLVDDETYTVCAAPRALRSFTPRRFFHARLLPADTVWIPSVEPKLYPQSRAREALQAAQRVTAERPEQTFRRPERLEAARRISRELYDAFVACFGADTITLAPREASAALRRFVHFQTFEFRGADGKTPAERSGLSPRSGATLPGPLALPGELDLHSLGLTAHPLGGLALLPDYGLLQEALEQPEKARRAPYRDVVLSYIEEPEAPAFVLWRLAERDALQMSRMIAAALNRKGFDWSRDALALLEPYKGDEAREPRFPAVVPIDTQRFDDLLQPRRARPPSIDPEQAIFRLKVTLKDIRPAIWRRIEVPGTIGLDALHETIQATMGWENCHLHAFTIGRMELGPPMLDEALDERQARLCDLVEEKDSFVYTYDMGDDWEHTIKVEKLLPPEPESTYPRCIAGERACPPEDCGGSWGYASLLEVLSDPSHEDYQEMRTWIGSPFDPEYFDMEAVNRRLLRRPRRRSRRR